MIDGLDLLPQREVEVLNRSGNPIPALFTTTSSRKLASGLSLSNSAVAIRFGRQGRVLEEQGWQPEPHPLRL